MGAADIARRTALAALLVLLSGVAVVFLTLPVVALIWRAPLRSLPELIRDPVVVDAIRVTVVANVAANLLIVIFGTPTAYVLATRRFRGRGLVITALELPLVLPPAVAGIALLVAYGRFGVLGSYLDQHGILIPFSTLAVVFAVVFVAGPYYLRQAIAAFEVVDPTLVAAARTLGAGPTRAFRTVALPLAAGGLLAGWALSFARGIGEFGATLLFAGNIRGVTQTLSLAVYDQLESSFDLALAVSVILLAFSAGILISSKLLSTWTPSSSPSTSRSATSP